MTNPTDTSGSNNTNITKESILKDLNRNGISSLDSLADFIIAKKPAGTPLGDGCILHSGFFIVAAQN